MIDEDTVFACALALWKASALNDTGARDLDREFVEMLDCDREPYLAGAREVLRAYLTAAKPAPTEDRGNYTDADYVRLHKAHCYTADKLAAAEARGAALIEALTEIARQKKTDELETEYEVQNASFEDSHDLMIDRSRAALAAAGDRTP
ncbi:MAG: hypothetical protein Q8M31_12430 [Beijerinckiaceae bacterium]|nr:hypothetical protein [Beijerinckiaceae bacterium]